MENYTRIRKANIDTNKRKKIFYIVVTCILLFSFIFFFFQYANKLKQSKKIIGSVYADHEIGVTESIFDDTQNSYISAHYPSVGKENIDKIIKDKVIEIINTYKEETKNLPKNNFANEKAQLNIDYKSYLLGNRYASIMLIITKDGSHLANTDTQNLTLVFDLDTQDKLSIDNILKDNYLKELSQISYSNIKNNEKYKDIIDEEQLKNGTSENKDNFSNFILKKNSLTIIFNKYSILPGSAGIIYLNIPYKKINDILNIKVEYGKIITKNEISAEVPEKRTRNIDKNKPMIALTFDDGPHKANTEKILSILSNNNAVATFFMLGNRAISYPDIAKKVYEQGSELGNHSWSHKQLTTLSQKEFRYQIDEANSAVYKATNVMPNLLRPPYGSVNDTVKNQSGMPLIMWDVDTEDWKSKNPDMIYKRAMDGAKDGNIILMHDIYSTTVDATERIVKELTNRGFQLVTISEMMEAKGIKLESGKRYFSTSNIK